MENESPESPEPPDERHKTPVAVSPVASPLPQQQQPKQRTLADVKPSAEAIEAMEHLKPVPGQRRVYTGSLLGACIVFLATMLGMPRLDTALHVALIAIAIAFPLLAINFIFADAEFEPLSSKLTEMLLTGYQLGVWVVGEGLGTIAVVVAFGAIMWHLSSQAVVIGLITFGGVVLVLMVVALGYIFYRAWQEYKASDKPDVPAAAPSAPDNSGPAPKAPVS